MTTLKQLGLAVLTHIFSSVTHNRAHVFDDMTGNFFGGLDFRQSENTPGDGQSGQVFYVWGPELGLRKLDMKEFRSFEEAIGQVIEEYAQVPTHWAKHHWSFRTDAGQWNTCAVYRFRDAEDRHFRAMLDTALKL